MTTHEPRPEADRRARDAFARAERAVFDHYGVDVASSSVELREPRLRARVLEAGEGPPVVLVHGGGGFASQWLPLATRLRGWRWLAVDRPGCGLSDAFDYRGVDVRRHAVDFLGSLLDALELERAPLVANSMGAMWALFFAFEHPERVSALSLLGCPALFPGTGAPLWLRAFSSPLLRAVLRRLPRPSLETVKRRMGSGLGEGGGRGASPAEVEALFLSQTIPGALDSLGSLVGRVVTLRGPVQGAGIELDELRALETPTQLVWGLRDPFGPIEAAERCTAVMRDATLERVEAGHMPWTTRPDECAALVDGFLRRQNRSRAAT